jgi:hypothetical protein
MQGFLLKNDRIKNILGFIVNRMLKLNDFFV